MEGWRGGRIRISTLPTFLGITPFLLGVFAWGVFAWVFLRIAWAFLRISSKQNTSNPASKRTGLHLFYMFLYFSVFVASEHPIFQHTPKAADI